MQSERSDPFMDTRITHDKQSGNKERPLTLQNEASEVVAEVKVPVGRGTNCQDGRHPLAKLHSTAGF